MTCEEYFSHGGDKISRKQKETEGNNTGHIRNDITTQNKNIRTLEIRTLTGIIQDGGMFGGESRWY